MDFVSSNREMEEHRQGIQGREATGEKKSETELPIVFQRAIIGIVYLGNGLSEIAYKFHSPERIIFVCLPYVHAKRN